jgi:hypothetical protein
MIARKPIRGEGYLVPTLLVPSHDHLRVFRVVVEVVHVDEERDVVRYAYRRSGAGPFFERPRLVFQALATLIEDGGDALTRLVREERGRTERRRTAEERGRTAEASKYAQERAEKFPLDRSRPTDRPRLVELRVRTTEFHHCFLPMPSGEPLPVSADGFVACPRDRGDWVGLVAWDEERAGYVLHVTNGISTPVTLFVDVVSLGGRIVKLRNLLGEATRIAASCHAHPPGGDPFAAFRGCGGTDG